MRSQAQKLWRKKQIKTPATPAGVLICNQIFSI